MLHLKTINQDSNNSVFELLQKNAESGPDNLTINLTANGVTVVPDFVFDARDASTTWASRVGAGSLAIAGSGSEPLTNQGGPFTAGDSVRFTAGKYYAATNTAVGDVTTNDFCVELIFRMSTAGITNSEGLLCKQVVSNGWQIYTSTSTIYFIINDGQQAQSSNATLSGNTWVHLMAFVNRDENSTSGMAIYANGVFTAGGGNPYTAADTITTPTLALTIGARPNGTIPAYSSVAYASLWQYNSWFQAGAAGPAEWATIAKERFIRLIGLYPQVAKGTALPTTTTRATNAYLPITATNGNTHLYQVGSSWLRVGNPVDSNGDQLTGYLAEPAATNLLLRSTSLHPNSGSWYTSTAGDHFGQLLVDGYMEVANTTAWTTGGSPTLTKDTTAPHSGTQCLRITYNGTASPYVYQNIFTAGTTYHITGWARGDGAASSHPYVVGTNGKNLWIGLDSDVWQYFDIYIQAFSVSGVYFASTASAADRWVEFDDLTVNEVDTYFAPNRMKEFNGFIAGNTDTVHLLSQDVGNLTAAKYSLSVYAKANEVSYINLTANDYSCFFGLDGSGVGTITAEGDETAAIESLGDGIYRCSLTWTASVTPYTVSILAAEADVDATFAGDGESVSVWLWGGQLELGDYPSTYVPTTSAAATRNADSLIYEGLANIGGIGSEGQGSLYFKLLAPNYTPATTKGIFNIYDASDSAASLLYGSLTTVDTLGIFSLASGGDAGAFGVADDPTDGVIHDIKVKWITDAAVTVMDGVAGTVDDAVDIPDELDTFRIGATGAGNQTLGYLGQIKIYKKKY